MANTWPRPVQGCVYGPYILPISSLYAWRFVFHLWLPVDHSVPLTNVLQTPCVQVLVYLEPWRRDFTVPLPLPWEHPSRSHLCDNRDCHFLIEWGCYEGNAGGVQAKEKR